MSSGTLPMHKRRRELGEASRVKILDAATSLMAERGYDGTSVAALEKASGFPASSIYWHFSNKEGVLAAVMERGALRFLHTVDSTTWEAGSAAEKLQQMFIRSGLKLITDPESSQFLQLQLRFRLNSERHQGKAFYETCQAVHREGIEVMHRQIFRAYGEHGEEAAEEVAAQLSELAVSMIDGIYLTCRNEPPEKAGQMLRQAAVALAALAEATLRK